MNTHNSKVRFVIFFHLVLFGFFAAGCRPKDVSARLGDGLNGTLTISGAWALYPMMIRWSEEFQRIHPEVRFDISAGGAGKGMADAIGGAVDIGMVSRCASRRD